MPAGDDAHEGAHAVGVFQTGRWLLGLSERERRLLEAADGESTVEELLLHSGLRHLVAAHLSAQNNRPDLARAALAQACGALPNEIVVADPALGFGWLDLS